MSIIRSIIKQPLANCYMYFQHCSFHVLLSVKTQLFNQSQHTLNPNCIMKCIIFCTFILRSCFASTDLIKSHKQTTPHVSGSGSHVSSINNNISNKSKSSFSWQRTKQPDKEKKQPPMGPPRKHSYSLDRRKMTSFSSGMSSRIVQKVLNHEHNSN